MKILNEIEAALAAATPGEWSHDTGFIVAPDPNGVFPDIYLATIVDCDDERRYDPDRYEANANCIALLHNHAPALIEAVKAMEEVIRISDRKHDAWDRAKAALDKLR